MLRRSFATSPRTGVAAAVSPALEVGVAAGGVAAAGGMFQSTPTRHRQWIRTYVVKKKPEDKFPQWHNNEKKKFYTQWLKPPKDPDILNKSLLRGAGDLLKKSRTTKKDLESGETSQGKHMSIENNTKLFETMLQEVSVIWIHYPWRRKPEIPANLPAQKLKNLHDAVIDSLGTRAELKRMEMMNGVKIPDEKAKEFEAKHPFLSNILKDLEGTPKGFPFWYKRYPTRWHAYENRFNIPTEMLDGYSEETKSVLQMNQGTRKEQIEAQIAMYADRYGEHALDTNSPAIHAIRTAIQTRELRAQALDPKRRFHLNHVKLHAMEGRLMRQLRKLRKTDFRKYWEIIRDHDMQDLIQPSYITDYKNGDYWNYDWDGGVAITTNIPDHMDPRGMSGCKETGRSRSEVARDLGLTYTRPLNQKEKNKLSSEARYYERLQLFKQEHPEQSRELQRQDYIKKFSGMFVKVTACTASHDFPNEHRRLLHRSVTRWRKKHHGPKIF